MNTMPWLPQIERCQHPLSSRLSSPDEFREILRREQLRTDRSGQPFSLLTFTVADDSARWRHASRLEAVLSARVRDIDEVGVIEPNVLGVALPYTQVSGAWRLAEDVMQELSRHAVQPRCEVYEYPCDDPVEMPIRDENGVSEPDENGARPLESFLAQPLPLWKRALDVLGAGVGLLLLSPLLLSVAAAIKWASPGPVFFRQLRSGLGGRPFAMYKFRTMVVDAEERKQDLMSLNEQDGPAFKITHDPRVTKIGRFLRRTSFDELPQLWNVLLGDMSLVGPRPLPCDESDACEGWHRRRLMVTPGLTCIWQVRGRSSVTFDSWVRMDMQYIRCRTLMKDMRLLLETVTAVALRRGAH